MAALFESYAFIRDCNLHKPIDRHVCRFSDYHLLSQLGGCGSVVEVFPPFETRPSKLHAVGRKPKKERNAFGPSFKSP